MTEKTEISKTETERLMLIEAQLLVNGTLTRNQLIDRYGISKKTASLLIKTYSECCPGQMILDKTPRRPLYIRSETCKPCLLKSLKLAKDYLNTSFSLNVFIDAVKSGNK